MIGKVFGKLTVINREGISPARHATWNCKCECGNEVIRTSTALKRKTISSCGCFSLRGKNHPDWDGVGDISKTWWTNRVTRARKNRKKVVLVEISINQAWDLFLKQDRKCAITGLLLKFPTHYKDKGTASLDRIDSSKNYSIDNVQWVHKTINIMKNDLPQSEFIKFCTLAASGGGACEI